MKTVTVVSDSHGNRRAMEKLDGIFAESDYIIHLGDGVSDGARVKSRYPDKTYLLNGNCDGVKLGEEQTVLEIEGVKIFACHGDKFGVKSGTARLVAKAAENGCSVALFGHTHKPTEQTVDGITLFNPGTLSRYSRNTYLYLVINGEKAVGKIVELQNQ